MLRDLSHGQPEGSKSRCLSSAFNGPLDIKKKRDIQGVAGSPSKCLPAAAILPFIKGSTADFQRVVGTPVNVKVT